MKILIYTTITFVQICILTILFVHIYRLIVLNREIGRINDFRHETVDEKSMWNDGVGTLSGYAAGYRSTGDNIIVIGYRGGLLNVEKPKP